MPKQNYDKEKVRAIIQKTYKCLREKEKNGDTKTTTIGNIVKIIEKELKDANQEYQTDQFQTI